MRSRIADRKVIAAHRVARIEAMDEAVDDEFALDGRYRAGDAWMIHRQKLHQPNDQRRCVERVGIGGYREVQLPQHSDDPKHSFGYVGVGQFMVIDRDDSWQCAYVIRKGTFPERREGGLPAFREKITRCTPPA